VLAILALRQSRHSASAATQLRLMERIITDRYQIGFHSWSHAWIINLLPDEEQGKWSASLSL